MKNPNKVAILEDMLARVHRNAGKKRSVPPRAIVQPGMDHGLRVNPDESQLEMAKQAPKGPDQAVRPTLDDELPPRSALDLSPPRAPMGTISGIGPELKPEDEAPPSAKLVASVRPPASVVLVSDDAMAAVEAGDEELLGDDEMLDEEDMVDTGSVMSLGDDDVVEGSDDDLQPVDEESAPASERVVPRARTIPPPLPVAPTAEPSRSVPPPLPEMRAESPSTDLEADVPMRMPPPRAPMPTAEQLGNTLDLDEGTEAKLELAVTPEPQLEAVEEEEAELPRAQAPGQYMGHALPATDDVSKEELDAHSLPLRAVELEIPESPEPLALAVAEPPPAPVAMSFAPTPVARRIPQARVPSIVVAQAKPTPTTFAELLSRSRALGE